MTQWKVKLTKQWDGKLEPFWNDRLSLWGVLEKEALSIFRYIDGRRVGAIPLRLRQNEELLRCQWEPDDGELFAVALRSGSVKIYRGRLDPEGTEGTEGAELVGTVVLGRGDSFQMEQFVWNRIKWRVKEPFCGEFDSPLVQWLPRLTEMSVSAQGKLMCTPLGYEGPEWNAGLAPDESNMFLTFDNNTRKVVLSIDGTFNFRYGEKSKFPTKVTSILPGNENNYVFINDEDWQLQVIRLEFTEYHQVRELMKCCSQIQFLMKYIRDNHRIMGTKLMEPHATFTGSLFPEEQFTKFMKGLKDVFYLGYSDEKSVENWFTLKLGRHGTAIWKQRNHLFWSSSQGFLVTCMIPACERLIVSAKRLLGLVKSLKLSVFGLDDDNELTAVEVQDLLQMSLSLLRGLVEQVEQFHVGENVSKDGLAWVEYMMDSLLRNEEEDAHNLNGQDGLFSSDLDPQEVYPKEHYSVQLFLNEYIIPKKPYNWIKRDFPNQLEALMRQFDLVQKNYTAKWIKKLIKVPGPVRKLKSLVGHRLEDALVDGDIIYMICSKPSPRRPDLDGDVECSSSRESELQQSIGKLSEETQMEGHSRTFTLVQYDVSSKELTRQPIPPPTTRAIIASIKFVPGESSRFLMLTEDGQVRRYLVGYSGAADVKNSARITIYNDFKVIMEPAALDMTNKKHCKNHMIVHSDMAVTILSPVPVETPADTNAGHCQLVVQIM
ncbi:AaceriAGR078Cp [[Ashbya] aceris (nom. inval.)]|nr:AaceriAGR078Cp [[Ashbya] aceris (nom. inval.)]